MWFGPSRPVHKKKEESKKFARIAKGGKWEKPWLTPGGGDLY
jgi:hypothetical protein